MSSIKKVLCVSSKRPDLVTKGFVYDVFKSIGEDYTRIDSDKGTPLVIGIGDYCNIGEWQPLEEYVCMTNIYKGVEIGDTFFGYKSDDAIIYPQGKDPDMRFGYSSNFKKVSEMQSDKISFPKFKRFEVRHVVYDAAHNDIIDDAMGECYITLAEAQELCDEMNAPKVMKPKYTKEVEYFGMKILVPDDAKFIAAGPDGVVLGSETKMELSPCGWFHKKKVYNVCVLDLNGIDWKETLVEIK